jgi:hypothetical protein
MAQAASARLVELRYIQQLVNKMIQLNNIVNQVVTALDGLGSSDESATADKILAAAGVAVYANDTDDTLTSEAVTALKALDWAYAPES